MLSLKQKASRAASLAPSVAPTPREQDTHKSSSPKSEQACGVAQIFLPSNGPINDASRVKNLGRQLSGTMPLADVPHYMTPKRGPKLERSSSAPSLRAATSPPSLSPQTPRSQRGAVRRASKVNIGVGALGGLSTGNPQKGKRRPSSAFGSMRANVSTDVNRSRSSPVSPKSGKRVSFVDEHEENRRRSTMVLGSLFDLRRIRANNGTSPADVDEPQAVLPEHNELEDTLMNTTLRDVSDTEAKLRIAEASLVAAQSPVCELGASRHATCVLSSRTLAVVQRKANLLWALDTRIEAFVAAQARREELLNSLLADPCCVPSELFGIRRFLADHVHQDGNPGDADKSCFDSFVRTFGLPKKHDVVLHLQRLADDATDWWASMALHWAHEGADATAIKRLITVATDIHGTSTKSHPKLSECKLVLCDRLAKEALEHAQKVKRRDDNAVAVSTKPNPESAKKAANEINKNITSAVSQGASPKHPDLIEAKNIACGLQLEEKNRHAIKALNFAQQAKQKDTAAVEACCPGVVPPVGPASEAADAIERAVNAAISDGAPDAHHAIKEALRIASALRAEDGQRKRMAARQKRLEVKR